MFYMSISAGTLPDILSSQIKSPASALNCILEYANQQNISTAWCTLHMSLVSFGENPAFLPSLQNSQQKCKNGIKCSAGMEKKMFSKCCQHPTLTFTNLREDYWIKKEQDVCCDSLNCTMSNSIIAPKKKKSASNLVLARKKVVYSTYCTILQMLLTLPARAQQVFCWGKWHKTHLTYTLSLGTWITH